MCLPNLARTDLGNRKIGPVERSVARLAPDPKRLLFCCSGADDEVAYVWSLSMGS
jgi:hypothetical protein